MKTSTVLERRLDDHGIGDFLVSCDELTSLDVEIDDLCRAIVERDNAAAAADELESLGRLQEVLATLTFKYKIRLTPRQSKLVQVYDRPDDPDARAYVFQIIARGEL